MSQIESSIPGWFWPLWSGAAIVAVSAALYSWIKGPEADDLSVAGQWMTVIGQYGIEPVYPPEEDIYVGDIYAVISNDALYNISAHPLPTRALKIGHYDLSSDLESEYREAYKFPASAELPKQGKIWPQQQSEGSIFAKEIASKSLPLAVLPNLKIISKRKSKLSAELANFGTIFGFSGSRETSVTIRPQGIFTYGVTAIKGEVGLYTFCQSNPNVCLEGGLRKQLSNIVGEDINKKIEDRYTGVEHMRYDVELSLVTRVYLMRGISTEIGDTIDVSADLEADSNKLSELGSLTDKAKSLNIESLTGSTISLPPQVFERPVVLGFRSVRQTGVVPGVTR